MPPFLGREIYFSRLFLPTYYLVDLQGLGNRVSVDSNQRVLLLICMELWGPCFGVKVRKVGLGAGPGGGGAVSKGSHSMSPGICRWVPEAWCAQNRGFLFLILGSPPVAGRWAWATPRQENPQPSRVTEEGLMFSLSYSFSGH